MYVEILLIINLNYVTIVSYNFSLGFCALIVYVYLWTDLQNLFTLNPSTPLVY